MVRIDEIGPLALALPETNPDAFFTIPDFDGWLATAPRCLTDEHAMRLSGRT